MKFTCPDCGHEKFFILRESPGTSITGEFSRIPDLNRLDYHIVCGECLVEWGYWDTPSEIEKFIRIGDYSIRRL